MNIITVLTTITKLIPVILNLMDTLETTFAGQGRGVAKMEALKATLLEAQDVVTDIESKDYVALVNKAITIAVKFNVVRGVFKKAAV